MTGGEGKKANNSTERKGTRKAWKGKIQIFKIMTQKTFFIGECKKKT